MFCIWPWSDELSVRMDQSFVFGLGLTNRVFVEQQFDKTKQGHDEKEYEKNACDEEG